MITHSTFLFALSWDLCMAYLCDEVAEGVAGIDSVVIRTRVVTH